jgi:hypothetical protein
MKFRVQSPTAIILSFFFPFFLFLFQLRVSDLLTECGLCADSTALIQRRLRQHAFLRLVKSIPS